MRFSTLSLAICCTGLAALAWHSGSRFAAADDVSFAGKTINMTIGFAAGSGTDLFGRTLGPHLGRHLPGNPKFVVLNQPGAGGVAALNDWANKAEPNGLSVAIGAQSQTDPDSLTRAHARYDTRTFKFVGGVAAYSQGLYINSQAVKRLTDRSANPVVMGLVGSTLRGGNYQALWGAAFLGWNVKWVRGYHSTADLRQALDRNEIDMSSFGSTADAAYLRAAGKFTIISQSGALIDGKRVKSAWLGDAPFIAELVEGKIQDPLAQQAFDYWQNLVQIGTWLALPPRTPDGIVATYVKAFDASAKDARFQDDYSKINPDPLLTSGAALEKLINKIAGVSPQTLRYLEGELLRQGLGE